MNISTDDLLKQATARPFTLGTETDLYPSTEEWCEQSLLGADNLVIAHINADVGGKGPVNAELFLRAVNSFEAMREALKGFIDYYEAYNPITDKRIEPYYVEAKKALALAEGKAVKS